jgi:hypothetical protein
MRVRTGIVVLGAALLVGVWGGPARAADGDAAAHYKKGRSLYNVSEYRAALDEFKQAYVLHEDPAFLYNIAQCHRQLGNHREAVTFYKRFLKESPGAPNRREIERLIGELEAKAAQTSPPPPAPPERDHAEPSPPPPADAAPPPPASPPPMATTPAAEPAPAPAAKAGVHFEVGLGGGGLHDSFEWIGVTKGTATGGSGAGHLALTFGVVPRLALGALLAGESVQAPHVELSGVETNNVGVGVLGMVGALADWRVKPEPTGLHFQGGVCFARMTIKDKAGAVPDRSPKGGGVALAAGWDWSLTPSWQFGVMGRFLGAQLTDQGITHDVVALSALALLSYH